MGETYPSCSVFMILQFRPSDQGVRSISSGLVILSRRVGDDGIRESDGPYGEGGIGESNGPEGEGGVIGKSDAGEGEDGVEDDGDGEAKEGDADSSDGDDETDGSDWYSGDMDESDGEDLDEGGDWEERSEPSLCFLLFIPLSLPLDLSSLLM